MTYQKEIGNKGEKIASNFLIEKGYCLIEHNYHTRYGEIDLVMRDDDMVVFVEVKTRTSTSFGLPEDSITPSKLERIMNAGLLWLQEHTEFSDDWRIDAVCITKIRNDNKIDIKHFINVVL